jgi:hypothetical protein
MADPKRQKRREIDLMQRKAVWLQKALFALRKAETADEKLADTREEKAKPYALQLKEKSLPLSDLEDALEERIETLLKSVKEMRQSLR